MNIQHVFPDLLIAGAPKSGTSSVHRWLDQHPDTEGSLRKETYFLSDPGTHMYDPENSVTTKGLEGYAANFPTTQGNGVLRFESTPSYIYSATALKSVSKFAKKPKVLFLLREPGEQIFSLYQYFRENWNWIPQEMDFADFLQAVEASTHDFRGNELAANCLSNANYAAYIRKWRDVVGREQIMIRPFENVKSDPRQLMNDVSQWLGIDAQFYDNYDFPIMNKTYRSRHRWLQSVNQNVRQFIPKSRLRDALRSVYRWANASSPNGPNGDVQNQLIQLSKRFASANAELSSEFGLDIAHWSKDDS